MYVYTASGRRRTAPPALLPPQREKKAVGKKISPQKKADRALCPVQVANIMQLKVHEVAAAMRAADVIEQLTPQHAREWMKVPAGAPQWFIGLLAESAARQAQRIAREEREELERRHKLVIAEEKVTRRLLVS
ncbi:hypothetical protein [Micromonospora rhizosphaerae]|uniref:hypothetical protein n=1 Tax=Micromonospora rhizosphaerae TaxID=568872 RepID=UPI00114CC49D|nr:hypothetical protein [Micromonospora rhizosphaerae]